MLIKFISYENNEIKAKYTPIFFSNSDYELAELYLKNSCDNVVKQDDELYFFENNFRACIVNDLINRANLGYVSIKNLN